MTAGYTLNTNPFMVSIIYHFSISFSTRMSFFIRWNILD